MSKRPPELAAGGVVWRKKKDSVQILLAHRPRYDDWAFPKGRLDTGENLMQCAIREVIEETGVSFAIGNRLPNVSYVKPGGRDKLVAYWAMRHHGGAFVPNREVDEISWVSPKKAVKRLSYDRDRDILRTLNGRWRKPARRIIMVRHGVAGTRGDWGKEDSKRPLSDVGKSQADGLPALLAGHRIDAIVTSPAKRCVQTVKPLARHLGLDVTLREELWEEVSAKHFRPLLVNTDRSTVVVCSHRPIVKDTLARHVAPLLGPKDLAFDKGSAWILDFDRAGVAIDAHYLPPPGVRTRS